MADPVSNYTSREFKGNIEANGINVEQSTGEAPKDIGTVDSFHLPLRDTYQKIISDVEKEISD